MDRFLLWLRRIVDPFIELSWSMQRRVDMRVLWPTCKELAADMDEAKAAFAAHAFTDPCWIGHYGPDGLKDFINALT